MVTTVDDYDLWEVEKAVVNTVTQASFYAHRHIKRSPYSTLFIQELNRILANIVRHFKARTVSKEQALARIGETYRSLGEQKRQLVIYGADYITDAMLSRGADVTRCSRFVLWPVQHSVTRKTDRTIT